jgi:hypothetical protein
MLREQVVIGETYIAKVSGKKVRVLIEGIDAYGGWWARNLETKRIVRVKDESHLTPLK